jgi:CAAX prenyl protease-like protein
MIERRGDAGDFLQKSWVPYALPFLVFLLFTESGRWLPGLSPYFYIIKIIVTGLMLWYWRKVYSPDFSSRLSLSQFLCAVFCGLLVLVIWILPEPYLFKLGNSSGFDPQAFGPSRAGALVWIGFRLLGASLVVPIMEELFWRSFLMRYLIDPGFRAVGMGTFSWFSFMGVAFLFGLEHHRVIVGIVAGLLYGLLLVWQKNLKGVVLAHAVTNLGLGIYVIFTGKWVFW